MSRASRALRARGNRPGRWRKLLLLPQVLWLGARAPRGEATVWERYWGAVRATGGDGDVLWDAGSEAEVRRVLETLLPHADASLPIVDLGCGNGRYTRALARHFPRALGVDLSARAVVRARHESAGVPGASFRTLDACAPGAGGELAAELGEANVFIRGVLHVVSHPSRVALLANARRLIGRRGVLAFLETNFRGGLLDYLQHLGARPGAIPAPLRRCIAYGLRPPSHFGAPELRRYFPATEWEVLTSGPADVHVLSPHAPGGPERIAGFQAVLRRRPAEEQLTR